MNPSTVTIQNIQSKEEGEFITFNEDPSDELEETRFILSNFWSNIYLTKKEDGEYRIDETYGKKARLETEYLLIKPAY